MIESNRDLPIQAVYSRDNIFNHIPPEILKHINQFLTFESRVKLLSLPLREWQWEIYYPLLKEVSKKTSISEKGIYIDSTKITSEDTETIIVYYFTRNLVERSLNSMTWQSLENYFTQKATLEKTAKTSKTAYMRQLPADEKMTKSPSLYSPLVKKIMEFEDRFFKEVMRKNHPFYYTLVKTQLSLRKVTWIQLLTLVGLIGVAYIIFFQILPKNYD